MWAQKSQIDLPITWDDTANVDYSVIGFGDDTAYLAADPANANNIVLKTEKPVGAQVWAGVVLGNDSLASAIPFSVGNTVMRAVVYAPDTGMVIRLKVENESNASVSVETDAITTVANAWDTLVFDFANNVSGTPAINYTSVYDKIAIFFDFGVSGVGDDFYLDYVEFTPSNNKAPISLPITWDDTATTDYTVIDFGGNASSLAADPNNASNIVLQSIKTTGAQVWGGTTFGNNLAQAIPFSPGYETVRAVVYSPDTGIVVKLKVEDASNPAVSVEADVVTTVANGWDTLSFDMSNHASGTSPINYTATYDKMSIFYDFGVAGANKTYYVDYVDYQASPALAQIDLPITWDDTMNVDYTVFDFGGNASSLAIDPTNSNNSVLMSTKTTGAQIWAGVSLGTALATPIPFSANNTIMRAVVYSPDTGIVVKLKVEDANDGTKSVETDVTTTVANAWDTLVFDMSNHSNGTPAINFSTTYNKASIFYDFGNNGSGKVYYVDYVEYVAPPAKSPMRLPITWDDTNNVDYTVLDFGGNASNLDVDPQNANNNVLKSVKTTGAQVWAGFSFGNNLAAAVPFSVGNTVIRARVFSPDTGIVVKLKVEEAADPTKSVETDVVTTVANAWDTLSFDFLNHSSGTSAINYNQVYDKMSIFYDFGNSGANKTYYVDYIEFLGAVTGIIDLADDRPSYLIYPNPANQIINVQLGDVSSIERIELMNSVGQIVYSEINVNSLEQINVEDLNEGVYFLNIYTNSERITEKVIVSK